MSVNCFPLDWTMPGGMIALVFLRKFWRSFREFIFAFLSVFFFYFHHIFFQVFSIYIQVWVQKQSGNLALRMIVINFFCNSNKLWITQLFLINIKEALLCITCNHTFFFWGDEHRQNIFKILPSLLFMKEENLKI